MEQSMEKMIEAVKVSYIYQTKYQKTKALSEVSCSFERGKVYAITGKSGSGKSTFLSLLAGLDVPTEGTLTVEGEDMRKMNRDAYRLNRASVIYQAFHLFPLLTVLENVMFPMELQHVPAKEAKARAREYLAKVGLPETLYKKRPNMISGGEQQRVAIARAIAAGGEILLADEPTGNLDSKTSQDVLGLLKVTGEKFGQTIVMITHNEEIAQLTDRIIRIEDGRILKGGERDE